MVGAEALQSVQFVTVKGKRLAVLSAEDWEAFIEWMETLKDTQIARAAFTELKAAGGDRKRAGWLEWEIAEKIETGGGRAAFVRADVAGKADVRAMIGFAEERFGGLDILVNNET